MDYKELDKNTILWSLILFILSIAISILFNTFSAANNFKTLEILLMLWIFIVVFSAVYLIWSFLFWIVGLISKKSRDNYKFKFLVKIATSVVVAILITYTLFMPICCGGTNWGGQNLNPDNITKKLLKTQINNPGAESCTDAIVFTKSKYLISAQGITINTGLDKEQIYFDNPEAITNFEIDNNTLRYTANSNKKVRMCILCSSEKENLVSAINMNKKANDSFRELPKTLPSNQTVCVIYPRRTT